jgi:hypothetical protein
LRSWASICLEQEHIVFADFAPPSCSEQLIPTICESSGSGHASSDISDQYALQLLEDVERRKAAAASVGLDFEVADSPCNFPL